MMVRQSAIQRAAAAVARNVTVAALRSMQGAALKAIERRIEVPATACHGPPPPPAAGADVWYGCWWLSVVVMVIHQVEWSPEERASLDAFVKQVPPTTHPLPTTIHHPTHTSYHPPRAAYQYHLPATSPLDRVSHLPVGGKVVSPGPSCTAWWWNLDPGAWWLMQVQHMNDMRLEAVKQRGAGGPNATQNVRREAEAGRLPGCGWAGHVSRV